VQITYPLTSFTVIIYVISISTTTEPKDSILLKPKLPPLLHHWMQSSIHLPFSQP